MDTLSKISKLSYMATLIRAYLACTPPWINRPVPPYWTNRLNVIEVLHDTLDTLAKVDSMKKSDKTNQLRAVLSQQKIPSQETPPTPPPETRSLPPEPPPEPSRRQQRKAGRRPGRDQHFWLHDDDRKLIRELAGWIGVQGERPSDSRIVRAALRITRTGDDFLRAYRQVSELDARLTKQDNQSG
jgi:hypothetical protein